MIQPFNTINASNSFFDYLDNDGEAELVAVLMDVLNHERLEILVVDPHHTSLHVAQSMIPRMYNGGPPSCY